MRNSEATEIVSDLAAQQWGLLTAAQARNAGVATFMLSRLVDRGIIVRIRHGVYASSSTPWGPTLEVRAQWLALEPTVMAADRRKEDENAVVVSHESAAELHGIGDMPSNTITFTTTHRRQTKQPGVRFYTATLTADEINYQEGLPVTTVARTVLDLARAGHEPGHLSDMITDAIANRLTTKDEVATALGGVAEIFGATGNTTSALRSRLDELLPEADLGDDPVARTIREAMAPIQQHIQELMSRLAPQLHLPAELTGTYTADIPVTRLDSLVPPEMRKILSKDAVVTAAMINKALNLGVDLDTLNISQDKLPGYRDGSTRPEHSDMGGDEDSHG